MFLTKMIKTYWYCYHILPKPFSHINRGKMTNMLCSKGHHIYFHVCKGKYQDILVIQEELRFVPIVYVFGRLQKLMEFSFVPKKVTLNASCIWGLVHVIYIFSWIASSCWICAHQIMIQSMRPCSNEHCLRPTPKIWIFGNKVEIKRKD